MPKLFRLIQRLSALATLLVAAPIILGVLGLVFLLSSFAAMMITGIIRQYYWGLRPFAGAATIGEWLLSITVYGTVWLVTFRIFDMKTGFSSLFRRSHGDSHGSAHFATRQERAAFEGGDGLLIGRDLDTGKLLRYDGPAHLLTLAPTRAGKGVGTVIPNLLLAERSVLVIDPKGENAKVAGEARKRFGAVHILDPFGVTGLPASAYNPLGRLDAESLDLGEDDRLEGLQSGFATDRQETRRSLNDLVRQEEAVLQHLRDDLEEAGRWKKRIPFIALFGLVLALGLTIALPRFVAGNGFGCAVLGGEWLKENASGRLACVFYGK